MIRRLALITFGKVADSLLGVLVGKALDAAVKQFCEQHGVEDDRKQLKDSLDRARLILGTIESVRIKDEVPQRILKDLLILLKAAAYDANNLFDEFRYRILKQQIEQQGHEAGNPASSSSKAVPTPSKRTKTSISSYISGLSRKGDDDDDLQRMRQIKRKLDKISDAFEKICSLADAEDDRGNIQLLSSASQPMGGDIDAIHLEGLDEEGLDEESLWKIFKKCAFDSSDSEVHHPHLEAMAKKMMCMLKGSSLAAKILGGLLSMKLDEQHWKSILDSELWQLPQEENGIMPVLQLSYQYLPLHLKQCFEFCSLFPKNYRFSESELISLWMAEGFIEPQENIRMEEIGSNYFHELVNRSFFQNSKYKEFIMHDLIHDLAELSSVGEFYRIEKGKSCKIPSTIHHLSIMQEGGGVMQTRCLKEFSHYNRLQTLMLSRRYTSNCLLVDCGILERLKKVHVLVLSFCALEELPDSIGMLMHLRYLDLSYNHDIRRLPESLCDLYNLQTLLLYGCCNLECLPHGMKKLINLRKLDGAGKLILEIIEVGKLTSLQNLSAFRVLKDNGHTLVELNGLNQLRGGLHITRLENVERKEEAHTASLQSKEHLDRLELEWTSSQESDIDANLHTSEQVLEELQPHHNLQSLTIKGYNGARAPNWLQEQVYSRLEFLCLENCKRWKDLSVEPLLNLNYLTINNCSDLRSIEGIGIKSLLMLMITGCPNLLLPQGEQIETSSLRELVIDDTAFMQQSLIKCLLSSLEHLTISFSCKTMIFEGLDEEALQGMKCLHSLCFSCCKNLQSLPRKLYTLTSLQSLQIYDCPQILSLPEKGLPPSLTNLDFEGCNPALEQQLGNHVVEIKSRH